MSFMVTAIAVTSAVGIYSAKQQYDQGKATAKGIEAQADVDRETAKMQMDFDAANEAQVMSKERKENRRLRAQMEAAYAGSGVLMEGSAADVMVKQRQVNEANVQNIHVSAGNQRAQDTHKMVGDYKSSIYLAKSTKYAAKQQAITTLIKTAAGAAVGVAGLSAGAATAGTTAAGTAGSTTAASASLGQVTAANAASFGGGAFAAPTMLGAGASSFGSLPALATGASSFSRASLFAKQAGFAASYLPSR
jgi:DNA-binding PucR family transcriptional regulator